MRPELSEEHLPGIDRSDTLQTREGTEVRM